MPSGDDILKFGGQKVSENMFCLEFDLRKSNPIEYQASDLSDEILKKQIEINRKFRVINQ